MAVFAARCSSRAVIRLPVFPARRFRLLLLGSGALAFVWLSLEDPSPLLAALHSLLLVLPATIGWLWRRFALASISGPGWLALWAGGGALAGLAAALTAALLMLLRNGLHAHIFPDFPFFMIAEMAALAPLWALGGGLLGVGAGGAVLVLR